MYFKMQKKESNHVSVNKFIMKAKHTGLPDQLKTGAENLSGFSMDDVRVHYNSSKPAQMQALAFTQGADIHVGPGQEKHLPHEAWHVIQQKQGRVQPTFQMKGMGVGVNDDPGLEREADEMGGKAIEANSKGAFNRMKPEQYNDASVKNTVLQGVLIHDGHRIDFEKGWDLLEPFLESVNKEEVKDSFQKKCSSAEEETLEKFLKDLNLANKGIISWFNIQGPENWEMPLEVVGAIKLLEFCAPQVSIGPDLKQYVVDSLKVIKKNGYKGHAELIGKICRRINLNFSDLKLPLVMNSRYIHSIWIQGDYTKEKEAREGVATRLGSKAAQWQNLIWVYQKLERSGGGEFNDINGIMCRPIKLHGLDMLEADFVATISRWANRPAWIDRFMPLLQILLAKKSYVTMSDIMRMIILYYKGGLYMDVKIQLETANAHFFDEPLVNVDTLQLVDAGMNKENWAMVCEAGCRMIERIMLETLKVFPLEETLERLPENYSRGGQYSKAHKILHERKGPWRQIERFGHEADTISLVNDSLKLKNPRPVNSWANDDGVGLEEQVERAGTPLYKIPRGMKDFQFIQEIDLSSIDSVTSKDLKLLITSIGKGQLPRLKKLVLNKDQFGVIDQDDRKLISELKVKVIS